MLTPSHEYGRPHLRVENRVLPGGPSVADVMANAAVYYRPVRTLAEAQRPIWTQLSFTTAAENLQQAACYLLDAQLYWPGSGEAPVAELVLCRLLPLAREGEIDTVEALMEDGAGREQALHLMTQRYMEVMHTNEPVHIWPAGPARTAAAWAPLTSRCDTE